MQCPIDQTALVMTERQGVEIDYCPKCRGVWLDRGELDKIIERAAQVESTGQRPAAPSAPPAPQQGYQQQPYVAPNNQPPQGQQYPPRYDDDDDDDRRYNDPNNPSYNPNNPNQRKKKSFLGDMFDIFD